MSPRLTFPLILILILIYFCTFCLSQKYELWTVKAAQQSQLLTTINNTFYPNINIIIESNISSILNKCPQNSNILYTASNNNNNYPNILNPITQNDYNLIISKSVNIYIEYPSCIFINKTICKQYTTSNIHQAEYERSVTVSPTKLSPLNNFTIIDLHQVYWIDITDIQNNLNKNDLLMIAKVAGYDFALYGFSGTTVYPLLYEYSNYNIILSLTSLSDYSIARYVPSYNIKVVLKYIINKLLKTNLNVSDIKWINPIIYPTMKNNNMIQSIQNGIQWIIDSKLLVYKYIEVNSGSGSRPTPSPTALIGDGSNGLFEGFSSVVNNTGGQKQSIIIRTDCQGEIAGSLAWSYYLDKSNQYHANISYNLLNFIYYTSIAQQQQRNDPTNPAYGLLLWGVNAPGWNTTVYCDDNSRAILGTTMATALLYGNKYNLDSSKFVPNIVRAILGNFRLTSTKGFCPSSVTMSTLDKNGWEYYWNGAYEFDDPHYESWIWCSYLYTYHITGYQPMYDRTVIGLTNMMNAFYAGTLHWANGLTQEYSRLLLPLSFLNYVENKQNNTHLKWLLDIGNEINIYFINNTIEEHYGNLKYGNAKPPQSNAQYGTTEAPLEQVNGDPVSDSLYTLPFAIWGLHEAYLLTNSNIFGEQLNNLTKYLMNIQSFVDNNANNDEYSYLNGSWFRGFDFNRTEYFASASDIGWGPYSIESGWTVGEILSAFSMITSNNSFFDVVNGTSLTNFTNLVKYYVPIFGLPPF